MRVHGWMNRQTKGLRAQLCLSERALLFISCVFLVKLLKISVPFLHLICKMRVVIVFSSWGCCEDSLLAGIIMTMLTMVYGQMDGKID